MVISSLFSSHFFPQGMPLSSVRRPKDKRWVESFAMSYNDLKGGWRYYEDEDGNPKVGA